MCIVIFESFLTNLVNTLIVKYNLVYMFRFVVNISCYVSSLIVAATDRLFIITLG